MAVWSSGQDQMSVVKRRLSSLLPGINIFLDVDDLKELRELETYLDQSGCILMFISRGYFYSTNCMREAKAVTEGKKPLVLLREDNLSKGGIKLADSIDECTLLPEVRDYVFNGRHITVWMRIQEHQLESLRQLAASMLLTMPQYSGLTHAELGLQLPDELRLQRLELPKKFTLYCSPTNPGAKEAAKELSTCLRDVNVSVIETSTLGGGSQRSLTRQARQITFKVTRLSGHLGSVNFKLDLTGARKAFLLYLTTKTWQDADDGSESPLAAQVRLARKKGIPLLIVHEADEARHGCDEFGKFFQTTCV